MLDGTRTAVHARAHDCDDDGAPQAVLERSIRLEPRYFDENISETLRDRLFHEVEGQCFGEEGYVLSICDILVVSLGFINDDAGSATYRIKYRALVFKPFHDEVLDAVVSNVTDTGITCSVGPFSFMVGVEVCSPQQSRNTAKNKASNERRCCCREKCTQSMGKGYEYDSRTESYSTPSGGELTKNSKVRAKLLNVISQVGRIVCCSSHTVEQHKSLLNSITLLCVSPAGNVRTRTCTGKCRLDGHAWLRVHRVIGFFLSSHKHLLLLEVEPSRLCFRCDFAAAVSVLLVTLLCLVVASVSCSCGGWNKERKHKRRRKATLRAHWSR